ncbi:hypothetical protein OEA41_000859 [Lepraria neglecta]|uniref:Uncharacterized protein n=1 Tax=Lepraria neglecta TaxID=209136 RepID=A0AAE0DQ74_9LECA|nr:hypothetical protein OEA41_000859 [Lepraria neglecta]
MIPFLTSPRCCILISFTIYLAAGREIFAKRQQLRGFSNPSRPALIEVENPFTSFKKTEIYVTTELATMTSPNIRDVFFPIDESDKSKGLPSRRPSNGGYDQYSVTISSAPPMSPTFQAPPTPPKGLVTVQLRNNNNKNKAANDANAAAFGYTKVALLFFVSLLVTWVPSSINRAYSLVHPDLVSLPFTYASGIVLPLMGFWNSVIYITTSWPAVRGLFSTYNYGVRRSSLVFNSRPSVGIRKWTGSESDSVKQLSPIGKGSGYDQV